LRDFAGDSGRAAVLSACDDFFDGTDGRAPFGTEVYAIFPQETKWSPMAAIGAPQWSSRAWNNFPKSVAGPRVVFHAMPEIHATESFLPDEEVSAPEIGVGAPEHPTGMSDDKWTRFSSLTRSGSKSADDTASQQGAQCQNCSAVLTQIVHPSHRPVERKQPRATGISICTSCTIATTIAP
jgi:hypothetical protein